MTRGLGTGVLLATLALVQGCGGVGDLFSDSVSLGGSVGTGAGGKANDSGGGKVQGGSTASTGGELDSSGGQLGASGGASNVTGGAGLTESAGSASIGEGGAGQGHEPELRVCVLNQAPASGECASPSELDFGKQAAGTRAMRLFRIENDTNEAVVFESAGVASSRFAVVPARYLQEPDDPTKWARIAETFPVTCAAGDSLYFEVTFTSGAEAALLPADQVHVVVQSSAVPGDVWVPMVGSNAGCATSFGACDEKSTNGCESSLLAIATCGSCSNDCRRAFSTMACDSGNCKVASCEAAHADCNESAADGCETNTLQSLEHCGGCHKLCDLPHAAETCASGACTLGQCETQFADCNQTGSDGCESNTLTDAANCGGCQHACASDFPGSLVSCGSGQCHFDGCSLGFVDLNADPADGCEYQCLKTSANDAPDDAFTDQNCDGIDGDVSQAIFVAVDGSDSNLGTMGAPMQSLNAALARALSTGKSQLYVSAGTYSGRVTLSNGISIYGGYSRPNAWRRSAASVTQILGVSSGGRSSAVEGSNLTLPTVLDRLSIESPAAAINSQSSYALYCSGCTGVTLKNSSLRAGNGSTGARGVNGIQGANGVSPTLAGGGGSCDGNVRGAGSEGGQRHCNGISVSGGRGGDGGVQGANSGRTGSQGQNGGGPGGSPGSGGDPGASGKEGQPGAKVSDGNNGAAGVGGSVTGGFWLSANGGNGSNGQNGRGGGGGGGGGGQGCTSCTGGTGNGGGGGGSGGCGGTAATGGGAGGGSFGLFLVNSTGIALTNNVIASALGGQGGPGGTGGSAGVGASGIGGGQTCTSEVGEGGPGGAGSAGGRGGHGGGGAGGPSYAVYRVNTAATLTNSTLSHGNGGPGGLSFGNSGELGASGPIF